jgi:hypothetical protein
MGRAPKKGTNVKFDGDHSDQDHTEFDQSFATEDAASSEDETGRRIARNKEPRNLEEANREIRKLWLCKKHGGVCLPNPAKTGGCRQKLSNEMVRRWAVLSVSTTC